MNLEEAILQLIELGEKDPLVIARKLEERDTNGWLAEQMFAYREQFLSELARHRLGSQRRSSQLALRPGDVLATAELKLRSVWVPEQGWTRAADMTVDDVDARAAYLERLSWSIGSQAAWFREAASLMRAEGAKTLGRLKASLPPLPGQDELEAA